MEKEITLEKGEKVTLSLVDTAGQEKFKCLSSQYYKNADAVLFVFALDDKMSFYNISEWMKLFYNNNKNKNILKYLIGNKNDLPIEIEESTIKIFLEEHKDLKYKSTSAKTENDEINKFFQGMGEEIFKNYKNIYKKGKRIKLSNASYNNKNNCALKSCVF